MKKCVAAKFLLTLLILFITFSVVAEINPVLAQEGTTAPTQAPKTLEEVKIRIQNILRAFPSTLKGTWRYALGVWKRAFIWMKDFWDSSIGPYIANLWHKIRNFFGKEVGLMHEILVVGRKFGADRDFWIRLLKNKKLFRRIIQIER